MQKPDKGIQSEVKPILGDIKQHEASAQSANNSDGQKQIGNAASSEATIELIDTQRTEQSGQKEGQFLAFAFIQLEITGLRIDVLGDIHRAIVIVDWISFTAFRADIGVEFRDF